MQIRSVILESPSGRQCWVYGVVFLEGLQRTNLMRERGEVGGGALPLCSSKALVVRLTRSSPTFALQSIAS